MATEKDEKEATFANTTKIPWRCALSNTILNVLKERKDWQQVEGDDWLFFWVSREWMSNQFLKHKFKPGQLVCHFRNDYELTRKDNLIKNIKRIRRQLEKEGRIEDANKYGFIPASYVLPHEYHLFVEEFRVHPPNTLWIMKPVSGAQGKGIFLFRKLKDITDWKRKDATNTENIENYLVQSYVENPYLIQGKKFDIRIYVLVTSFRPLKAWLHREGFARFSHTRYNTNSIADTFSHLTNVAVAKLAPDYDPERGLKWSLQRLKRFLIAMHGYETFSNMMEKLGEILIKSLEAVQNQIIQDSHCFELYGYDILLDSSLKPWLLEVNASPSLTASSQEDLDMKSRVLNHMIDVLDLEKKLNGDEIKVGSFDLFLNGDAVMNPSSGLQNREKNTFKHILNIHLGDFAQT